MASSITSWQDGDPLSPTHLNSKMDTLLAGLKDGGQLDYLALTSAHASSGVIRLPNSQYIQALDAAGTTDVPLIGISGANNVLVGGSGSSRVILQTSATSNLQLGPSGNVFPGTDGSVDLGGSATHWRTVYGTGGVQSGVTVLSAGSIIGVNSRTVIVNSASASTVTIPAPSTVTGSIFGVKRLGSANVMVTCPSLQSIDNLSVYTLGSQFSTIQVQSYGTGYAILSW